MNTQEAFKLLTLASARDGRTVDVAVASVWADDLADVSLEQAVFAAREHYRGTDAWLMPAHILRGVQDARRKALPSTMSPEVPEDCGNHRWMPDGTCLFCLTRREVNP